MPDSRLGYYVVHNARLVQLRSGRLILPLSFYVSKDGKIDDWQGQLCCSCSDDGGKSWTVTRPFPACVDGRRVDAHEPGVIELRDGRLLMWIRSSCGLQLRTFSCDGGMSWEPPQPWNLLSPSSPATVRRLKNGDLIAFWNNHASRPEPGPENPLNWVYGDCYPSRGLPLVHDGDELLLNFSTSAVLRVRRRRS